MKISLKMIHTVCNSIFTVSNQGSDNTKQLPRRQVSPPTNVTEVEGLNKVKQRKTNIVGTRVIIASASRCSNLRGHNGVLCGWDKCAIYLSQLLSNGALALIHCTNDGQPYQKDWHSMNTQFSPGVCVTMTP